MMTATVVALGLVPFLFASGPGSEIDCRHRWAPEFHTCSHLFSCQLSMATSPGERPDKIAEPNLLGGDRI